MYNYPLGRGREYSKHSSRWYLDTVMTYLGPNYKKMYLETIIFALPFQKLNRY